MKLIQVEQIIDDELKDFKVKKKIYQYRYREKYDSPERFRLSDWTDRRPHEFISDFRKEGVEASIFQTTSKIVKPAKVIK